MFKVSLCPRNISHVGSRRGVNLQDGQFGVGSEVMPHGDGRASFAMTTRSVQVTCLFTRQVGGSRVGMSVLSVTSYANRSGVGNRSVASAGIELGPLLCVCVKSRCPFESYRGALVLVTDSISQARRLAGVDVEVYHCKWREVINHVI